MGYEIVKDKPLPPRAKRGGRRLKYPFAAMEVGDAFCVPVDGCAKRQANLITRAAAYTKQHGPHKKFTTRLLDGDVWVWRIA